MSTTNAVTGTITEIQRLRNSYSGNPRFSVSVHLTNGDSLTLQTQADASVNYDIENLLKHGKPVRFQLSRAGRIIYATAIEK